MPAKPAYRILSLDGGGAWALIQSRTLGSFYGDDTPGRQILGQFDLVTANSGGSLVAAGLAIDMTPKQITATFLDQEARDSIFVRRWNYWIAKKTGALPRYKTDKKYGGLRSFLNARQQRGDTLLLQIPQWMVDAGGKRTHFVICTFDYDLERGVLLRSNWNSLAKSSTPSLNVTLAQAVHASTNAPIKYFDAPAEISCGDSAGNTVNRRFWDGGLAGYNNPAFVAAIENLANPQPLPIAMLSIGTGNVVLPVDWPPGSGAAYTKPLRSPGRLNDIELAATSILDEPPANASWEAYISLGNPAPPPGALAPIAGNVVRLNPLVQPWWTDGQWTWPTQVLSSTEFNQLCALELDATEQEDVVLIDKFCSAWMSGAVPNEPIRAGDHFRCEVGHDLYADALAHWRSLP